MKKCPNCNAEMDENANFCIYCMTSFDKKEVIVFPKIRKKTSFAVSASATVAVVACGALVLLPFLEDMQAITQGEAVTSSHSATVSETRNTQGAFINVQPSLTATDTALPEITPNVTPHTTPVQVTVATSTTVPMDTKTPKETASVTAPTVTATPKVTVNNPTLSVGESTTAPYFTQEPSFEAKKTYSVYDELAGTNVTYTYRAALHYDFYNSESYQSRLTQKLVITKVSCEGESTGVYSIPSKIDGYSVICVEINAFEGIAVNTVYFPRSIERIKSPIIPYGEQGELHFYIKSDKFYFDYTYRDEQGNRSCHYKDLTVHCPEEALGNPSSGEVCAIDKQLIFSQIKYEQWDG